MNNFSRLFKHSIRSSELAQLLFSQWVLRDEHLVLNDQFEQYKNEPDFKSDIFEQKVFLYLVANVAIALTNLPYLNRNSPPKNIIDVITHFRSLVRSEMHKRWNYSQEIADEKVVDAASKYETLLYTNPKENRALTIDWTQQWLEEVGVREINAFSLLKVSHAWKTYHITLAKFLSKQKVSNG